MVEKSEIITKGARMDKSIDIIEKAIKNKFPDIESSIFKDQLTLNIKVDQVLEVAKELRDNENTKFEQLLDVTAIDWNRRKERFELVYIFYSISKKHRVRVETLLDSKNPTCQSLTPLYDSANWYERETYDMFGIKFENHPGLRRFYMPEDYVDPETKEPLYPLRKDFPLMGIPGSLPLPPFPEKYGEVE